MNARRADDLGEEWLLDPAVTFLNHGSFGACPRAVLAAQAALRERMEREPVRFLTRELPGLLADARSALASFIGADADDLAFVPNATSAVNAVLRSLPLCPGDELLVTDHAYAGCRNALDFAAEHAGARVVVVAIPLPVTGPGAVVESVLEAVGSHTRLALLDHVTSPSALVFPIARLVAELDARGVDTLVDGAHAPGMLPLDVRGIGAAYYTGNCHKWLCAPKGSAFLHVRRDRREGVRPLTISRSMAATGALARFRHEFDWMGTDDPTPYLTVPVAIRHLGSLLPGGWPELMGRNRCLALAARDRLVEVLNAPALAPDAMLGCMISLPLPDGAGPAGAERLHAALLERFAIEVPVIAWPAAPHRLIRVSAQLYNTEEDYVLLARALRALM